MSSRFFLIKHCARNIHHSINKYLRSEIYKDKCLIYRFKKENMQHLKLTLQDFFRISFLKKKKNDTSL